LPNSECTACACQPGYHGDQCEFRHAILTLNFHKTSDFSWYTPISIDEIKFAVWKTELEHTIDALIQFAAPTALARLTFASSRRVNDTRGDEFIQVKLRIGAFPSAAAMHESWNTYEALRQLRILFTRPTGARVTSPVFKHPLFSSSLYLDRGVGMKDPNCHSRESGACPKGTLFQAEIDEWKPDTAHGGDPVSGKASKSSTKTSIAIGVGVGIGSLLLLGVALYYLRRSGHICGPSQPPTKAVQAADTTEHQAEAAIV
jgi:hypothetical protein